jgi:glycosyltransferase involved in cell wall biosynthesis
MKHKILRLATVPIYMNIVLKGQLKYLNQYYNVIAATSYDQKHFNEIQMREGVTTRKVDLCRTIKPFEDLKALIQLLQLIRNEKPILIHTHTPKAGLLGMLAGLIMRVPIRIHTVTGMPLMGATGLKRKLLIVIEKLTYAMATMVYPNSHAIKNYIQENNFVTKKKLKVLSNGSTNGVDTVIFDPIQLDSKKKLRLLYKIEDDAFVFLFVGRIAKEKGIEELVLSLVNLIKEYPEKKIKLLLIGTFERQHGLLPIETEQFIEKHPDIISLGRFDDVRPFYKLSDVFVLPSYREGFPNAVLEAGAMGLPSIVTNINGCNEIIVDGINGNIIPVQDVKKLYLAMEKMLTLNENLIKMNEKARKMVCDRYDRQIMLKLLKEEYDFLINNINK